MVSTFHNIHKDMCETTMLPAVWQKHFHLVKLSRITSGFYNLDPIFPDFCVKLTTFFEIGTVFKDAKRATM